MNQYHEKYAELAKFIGTEKENWARHELVRLEYPASSRSKMGYIVDLVFNLKEKGEKIDLELDREKILEICHISEGDKEYRHDIRYLAQLVSNNIRNYYKDVKVSYKNNVIHIIGLELTNKLNPIIDSILDLKEKGLGINLGLTREKILEMCNISEGDKEYRYNMKQFGQLIKYYIRKHTKDVKVTFRGEHYAEEEMIFVMDLETYNLYGLGKGLHRA